MPKPAVLILETDKTSERQLNDILESGGFDVYAADDPRSLLQALKATPFPIVIVDAETPNVPLERLALSVTAARSSTSVIFTSSGLDTATLLQLMRLGIADHLTRPWDPAEVVARVKANVLREQNARAELRTWKQRARTLEMAMERTSGSEATIPLQTGPDPQQVLTFARAALDTFLDLEKQYLDLSRKHIDDDPEMAARMRRPLTTWICHEDPEFVRGITSFGPKLRLDFAAPMSTGGEILDRLSDGEPHIILIGDSLPDIPQQLIVDTVRGQSPDSNLILIEGWGSNTRRAVLMTGSNPEDVARPLHNVDDLIALIEVGRERAWESMLSRSFAERFRARHAGFLQSYAEVMRALGEDGSTSHG